MTSDLFPDCRQDSPRLAWMKRHGISIIESNELAKVRIIKAETYQGYKEEYRHFEKYFDYDRLTGWTNDEMLADFARYIGIPLWNEEEYINGKEAE